jgi:hypothetical protein
VEELSMKALSPRSGMALALLLGPAQIVTPKNVDEFKF